MDSPASSAGSDDFVMLDTPHQDGLLTRQPNFEDEAEQDFIAQSSDNDLEFIKSPDSVRSLDSPLASPDEAHDYMNNTASSRRANVSSLVQNNSSPSYSQPTETQHETSFTSSNTIEPYADVFHPSSASCHNHQTIDQQIFDMLIEHALTARIEREHGRGSASDKALRQQMMVRFRSLPSDHTLVRQSLSYVHGGSTLFPGQKRSHTAMELVYHTFFSDIERTALVFFVECHLHHFEHACDYYGSFMPLDRHELNKAMKKPEADQSKALATEIQSKVLGMLDEDRAFTDDIEDLRKQSRSYIGALGLPHRRRNSSHVPHEVVDHASEPAASNKVKGESNVPSAPHSRLTLLRRAFQTTLANLPNTKSATLENAGQEHYSSSLKREPPEDEHPQVPDYATPPMKRPALSRVTEDISSSPMQTEPTTNMPLQNGKSVTSRQRQRQQQLMQQQQLRQYQQLLMAKERIANRQHQHTQPAITQKQGSHPQDSYNRLSTQQEIPNPQEQLISELPPPRHDATLPWPVTASGYDAGTAKALQEISSKVQMFKIRNEQYRLISQESFAEDGDSFALPPLASSVISEYQKALLDAAVQRQDELARGNAFAFEIPQVDQSQSSLAQDPAFRPAGDFVVHFGPLGIDGRQEPLSVHEKTWLRAYGTLNAQKCSSDERLRLVEDLTSDWDLFKHLQKYRLDPLEYHFRMEALMQLRSMQLVARADARTANTRAPNTSRMTMEDFSRIRDHARTLEDAAAPEQIRDIHDKLNTSLKSKLVDIDVDPVLYYFRWKATKEIFPHYGAEFCRQVESPMPFAGDDQYPRMELLTGPQPKTSENASPIAEYERFKAQRTRLRQIDEQQSIRARRFMKENEIEADPHRFQGLVQDYHDAAPLEMQENLIRAPMRYQQAVPDPDTVEETSTRPWPQTSSTPWSNTIQEAMKLDKGTQNDSQYTFDIDPGLLLCPERASSPDTRAAAIDPWEEHFSAQSRVALSGSDSPAREYRQDTLLAQSTNLPTEFGDSEQVKEQELKIYTGLAGDVEPQNDSASFRPTYQFAPANQFYESGKTFLKWGDELRRLEEDRERERRSKELDGVTLRSVDSETTLVPSTEAPQSILGEDSIVIASVSTAVLPIRTHPATIRRATSTEKAPLKFGPLRSPTFEEEEAHQKLVALLEANQRRQDSASQTSSVGESNIVSLCRSENGKSTLVEPDGKQMQDYQRQLMLLEAQNVKNLYVCRQVQSEVYEEPTSATSLDREQIISPADHIMMTSCPGEDADQGDYNAQLAKLEQQNKKRLQMSRGAAFDSKVLPPALLTRNQRSASALRDYRVQLNVLELQNQRRLAIARLEFGSCEPHEIPQSDLNGGSYPSNAELAPIQDTTLLRPPRSVERGGITWIAFEYLRAGETMEWCIRTDIHEINTEDIPWETKDETCLHEMCTGWKSAEEAARIKFKRILHEQDDHKTYDDDDTVDIHDSIVERASADVMRTRTTENKIGWALAALNPCLCGSPGNSLLRTAVEHFIKMIPDHNTNQAQSKNENSKQRERHCPYPPPRLAAQDPFVVQTTDDIMAHVEEDESGSEESCSVYDDEGFLNIPPYMPQPFLVERVRYIMFDFNSPASFGAIYYSVRADVESISVEDVRARHGMDRCVCSFGKEANDAIQSKHNEECDMSLVLSELNPMLTEKENKKLLSAAVGNFFLVRDRIGWHHAQEEGDKIGTVVNFVLDEANVDDAFTDYKIKYKGSDGPPHAQCVHCNWVIGMENESFFKKLKHLRTCEFYGR